MKKALGVALVAVLVLGVTSMALARWGGPGMGMGFGPRGAMMGQGAGMGPGTGFGPGAGPCGRQGATGATATAIDEAKAKEIGTGDGDRIRSGGRAVRAPGRDGRRSTCH